tara:strand:- start:189 stop:395 length:207 start_codon:yes stop_codon:yes gene_type:complete
MPIKYKKSQKGKDKKTGKETVEHFYVKQLMNSELKDLLTSANIKPKVRVKILNEIVKRKWNGENTREN